jgi:hypothetical protein
LLIRFPEDGPHAEQSLDLVYEQGRLCGARKRPTRFVLFGPDCDGLDDLAAKMKIM